MQTTVIWLSLFVLLSGYRDHYDGAYDYLVRRRSISCICLWQCWGSGLRSADYSICYIVSLALLAVTRPLAMKYFNQERQKTGAELSHRTESTCN